MIALQRSFVNFSNQTEAKLALLRDVLRRVQAGEDVDVEAELGTGDATREKEWEEGSCFEAQAPSQFDGHSTNHVLRSVMRELEEEDRQIQSWNQRRRAREAAAREAAASNDPKAKM